MTDIEILDQGIANIEGVQRCLYTFRRMVAEIGNLADQHKNLKSGIEGLRGDIAAVEKQAEDARAELAKIAQQRQQIVNEIAALKVEVATKQTELQGLSNAIEQCKQC